MLRLLTMFFFVLLLVQTTKAQVDNTPIHSQTAAPANSRYELIQSTLAAKWTFLLDKVTGVVKQLVKTKDDSLSWDNIPVFEKPKTIVDGKIRYQIFMSGLAVRHTFLINVETGQTWVLTQSTDNLFYWEPFK